MSLASLVRDRSLIVCVGPGGVGKTTVSAAIGVAGAKVGRKVVVLTIDPARRLADALGLPGLDDAIRSVPVETVGLPGSLDAAMVDTEKSYASLIERIAEDPAVRDRILNNRVFHAVSHSMARSHAYVAMERLYDAMENRDYDLVVLDTPPARNALDILDAPQQLARFLDGRVVDWFVPGEGPRGIADRLLAAGGEVAKRLLGMITGQQLLDEIVEFLVAFASLREGFIARAERVQSILTASKTGFVLVSSASPASADDAAWLRHDLERRKVAIDHVVFNQSYTPIEPEHPATLVTHLQSDVSVEWNRIAPRLPPEGAHAEMLAALRMLRVEAAQENARLQGIVEGMVAELPAGQKPVRVPRFSDELRDLAGLVRLAALLTGEPV